MNTSRPRLLTATCAALLAAALTLTAADPGKGAKKPALKPYILKICVVTELELDDAAVVFNYESREIKVCCNPCVDDFLNDPFHFVELIEKAEKKKKRKKGNSR